MALLFFKEDMPELYVIAADSLLEFALKELPTFGLGRQFSYHHIIPISKKCRIFAKSAIMLVDGFAKNN